MSANTIASVAYKIQVQISVQIIRCKHDFFQKFGYTAVSLEAAEDYEATSSKTFVSRRHPELLLGASQWDHQGK